MIKKIFFHISALSHSRFDGIDPVEILVRKLNKGPTEDKDCSIQIVESIPEGLVYDYPQKWMNIQTFEVRIKALEWLSFLQCNHPAPLPHPHTTHMHYVFEKKKDKIMCVRKYT